MNITLRDRIQVEYIPPNITYFSLRRLDRYTRYKFSLAAQTEAGVGEAFTEESPHFTTEGNFSATFIRSLFCKHTMIQNVSAWLPVCMNRIYPGASGHRDAGLVHWLNVCRCSPRSHHTHSLFHQEKPRRKVPRCNRNYMRHDTYIFYYAFYII